MSTDLRSCPACHSDLSHCGTTRTGVSVVRCGNCDHVLAFDAGDAQCDCYICRQGRQQGASLGGTSQISPAG